MRKRICLMVCLLSFCSMLFAGCETTKGVAVGVGATAVGAAKDTKSLWQAFVGLDEWIKRNLW